MTQRYPEIVALGQRFARPASETLVRWINQKNNRQFHPDQFVFGVPIDRGVGNNTVDIPFHYRETHESSTLQVQRVDISLIPGLGTLAIHSHVLDVPSVLSAIHEQYGLYLDADMVEVVLEDGDLEDPEAGVDGVITILPNHLLYVGEMTVKVRRSLVFNNNTMDRVLDLREFYSQSGEDKPYVETYQPKGLWSVEESEHYNRRMVEAGLFTLGEGGLVDYTLLALLLSSITGSEWVASPTPAPFNIMNSTLLYNGLASEHPGIAPISHSYLIMLELSELCENLQGTLSLAYRYSTPHHPAAYPGGYNYLAGH